MKTAKLELPVLNIQPKLIFWKRWESQFGEPRTGTLKYALLNRRDTGFDRCVRIINNRIYLDVEATFNFFNSCRDKTCKS